MIAGILGYVGMVLLIGGFFLLNNKKRKLKLIGSVVYFVAATILLIQAVFIGQLSLVLLNAFMAVISLYGFSNNFKG